MEENTFLDRYEDAATINISISTVDSEICWKNFR